MLAYDCRRLEIFQFKYKTLDWADAQSQLPAFNVITALDSSIQFESQLWKGLDWSSRQMPNSQVQGNILFACSLYC